MALAYTVAENMRNRDNNYSTPFFLSQVIGSRVVDNKDAFVGKLSDIIVNLSYTYPKVVAIVIKNEKQDTTIPISNVETATVSQKSIILKISDVELPNLITDLPENTLALRKSVLDQQIVDLNGAKVIRVNDLRMLKSGAEISVTDVDVGYRGLMRRLGVETLFEKMVFAVKPKNLSMYSNKFVSWEYVHPVMSSTQADSLKLTVPKEQFKMLNPADIADILEELDYEQRKSLINQIPDDIAAKVLSETDSETTQELIETQKDGRAADILEQMAPDKAADILGDMQEEKAQGIIDQMDREEAETVTELLEYEDNTAGGLMTTEYLSFSPNTIVVNAIQELVKASEDKDIETIYEAFIVEEGKLVGIVSLRSLMLSQGHKPLSEVMNKKPVDVTPDEKAKDVAALFSKYNLLTLPVVQETGELEGIITVDDVVEFLMRKWQ